MIRTNVVQLSVIPAVAYRQKLPSGGSGVVVIGYESGQPGLAGISKTSGKAIPSANTPVDVYPMEAFEEAIALTSGMPYRKQRPVGVIEKTVAELPAPEAESEELAQEEVIVSSEEYGYVVELYTNKQGKLSYALLNRDLIRTARRSGKVKTMVGEKASVEEIRLQVVKAKLREVTRNPALTDAQVGEMIRLLDDVSPRGVFRELNAEIRKWLAAGKTA